MLAIAIAVYSNIIANNANSIALDANKISSDSKSISREALDFSRNARSQQIVEDSYDKIYVDPANRRNMESIKAGFLIGKNNLLSILDNIEGVGNSFCQGTAWRWHINTMLKNTLSHICDNTEIYDNFAGKKNGTAMLCSEFFPNSLFAKSLNKENIGTCMFYDSETFNRNTE